MMLWIIAKPFRTVLGDPLRRRVSDWGHSHKEWRISLKNRPLARVFSYPAPVSSDVLDQSMQVGFRAVRGTF